MALQNGLEYAEGVMIRRQADEQSVFISRDEGLLAESGGEEDA